MNNWINNIMFGLVNQHQVWVRYYRGKIEEGENQEGQGDKDVSVKVQGGSSGAVYGLGIIGASMFYMGKATTRREKFLGFLKSLVWPVYLVRQMLEFLGKQ
jgi:hypothetical protein